MIELARQIARRQIIDLLCDDDAWPLVVYEADRREAIGAVVFRDVNRTGWSDQRIRAEVVEEVADALVYLGWLNERALSGATGTVGVVRKR